jgi:hypothetical protein
MAIEDPSSVVVDGRLRARASIPLDDGRRDGQTTIGLVLQWLDNSHTYSGMMTPSAAPRRRPVPREESLDMCTPEIVQWVGAELAPEVSD